MRRALAIGAGAALWIAFWYGLGALIYWIVSLGGNRMTDEEAFDAFWGCSPVSSAQVLPAPAPPVREEPPAPLTFKMRYGIAYCACCNLAARYCRCGMEETEEGPPESDRRQRRVIWR